MLHIIVWELCAEGCGREGRGSQSYLLCERQGLRSSLHGEGTVESVLGCFRPCVFQVLLAKKWGTSRWVEACRQSMVWATIPAGNDKVSKGQLNTIKPSMCRWKVFLDAHMFAICGWTHEAKISKTLWHSGKLKQVFIFLFMFVSSWDFLSKLSSHNISIVWIYTVLVDTVYYFVFFCNAELWGVRWHVTSSHPSDVLAGGDWRRSHYGSCPSQAQWINVDRNGNSKNFCFLSEDDLRNLMKSKRTACSTLCAKTQWRDIARVAFS